MVYCGLDPFIQLHRDLSLDPVWVRCMRQTHSVYLCISYLISIFVLKANVEVFFFELMKPLYTRQFDGGTQ